MKIKTRSDVWTKKTMDAKKKLYHWCSGEFASTFHCKWWALSTQYQWHTYTNISFPICFSAEQMHSIISVFVSFFPIFSLAPPLFLYLSCWYCCHNETKNITLFLHRLFPLLYLHRYEYVCVRCNWMLYSACNACNRFSSCSHVSKPTDKWKMNSSIIRLSFSQCHISSTTHTNKIEKKRQRDHQFNSSCIWKKCRCSKANNIYFVVKERFLRYTINRFNLKANNFHTNRFHFSDNANAIAIGNANEKKNSQGMFVISIVLSS